MWEKSADFGGSSAVSGLYRMLSVGLDVIGWDGGEDMRLRTWLVAALGLGSLVVLMAVSMLASARTAQDIYVQLDELNRHHRRVEESLRRLRSDVNLSGIFVRDYLLDIARERAPEYRQQIAEFRRTNSGHAGRVENADRARRSDRQPGVQAG